MGLRDWGFLALGIGDFSRAPKRHISKDMDGDIPYKLITPLIMKPNKVGISL